MMLGHLSIERLEDAPPASFNCGREEQDLFFHEHSWTDQAERLSVTYVVQVHGMVAAYATVCADALPLSRRERGPLIRYRTVSAMKLAQLGVDHRFQGMGLGAHAVAFVLKLAREIGERAGCRYVTLDAQPALEPWYRALGFVRNEFHQEQRISDARRHRREEESVAVSMRFDLRPAA